MVSRKPPAECLELCASWPKPNRLRVWIKHMGEEQHRALKPVHAIGELTGQPGLIGVAFTFRRQYANNPGSFSA